MKNLFKYASLLMAAAMLFACEGNDNGDDPVGPNGNTGSEFKLTADKAIIQTFGGDFATLSVTLGDEKITEEVIFFDGDKKVIEIPDFKFAVETPGEYVIIASYGTYISEPLTIRAIGIEIPETPADPNPGSTDFKARVLMTEFTTTGCTYCPGMKSLVHQSLADAAMVEKFMITECHSGTMNNVKDSGYIKTGYEDFSQSTGYPYMFCDMYYGFGYYPTWSVTDFNAEVDKLYSQKAADAAGIAVVSSLKDGQLVAKVTVKASVKGNYRIGAFILEDGIYGAQTSATADWMNRHDNVIRYIDSKYYSKAGKEQFYGHSLGSLESGKTADYIFIWDLNTIWDEGSKMCELYGGTVWGNAKDNEKAQTVKKGKAEFVAGQDLHLAVFTSTIGTDLEGNEFYYVNNVVDSPVNGETPYEYK